MRKKKNEYKVYYHNLSFSAGLRRYIAINDKLYFILAGNVVLNRRNQSRTTTNVQTGAKNTTETANSTLRLNISPGLTYFINPHFGLETFIGGFGLDYNAKSKGDSSSSFSANFTSSGVLSIGIAYYF
jgi:hypothetical protein